MRSSSPLASPSPWRLLPGVLLALGIGAIALALTQLAWFQDAQISEIGRAHV